MSCAGLPHSLRSISAATRPSPLRVIFEYLDHPSATILFSTRFVGELRVTRNGDWLTLDFPAWSTSPVENPPADLLAGLGLESAVEVREGRDYLVVLADRQQVEACDRIWRGCERLAK